MTKTSDIVAKLWGLCDILKDGGITYQQYVTELVLLLFLKMAKETGTEQDLDGTVRIPKELRWDSLISRNGTDLFDHYQRVLLDLAKAKHPLVRGIYAGAQTSLRKPLHLERLVQDLDGLNWYEAREEGLGDMYEGLLEKNANESKKGAGQYFTPRVLIDSMVALVQPKLGEVIEDPAAGTAGFLIAADKFIKEKNGGDLVGLPVKKQEFQRHDAFVGMELVPETRRLALMNCLLHNIHGPAKEEGAVFLGDTLSGEHKKLPAQVDVILTNPPFGTARGGGLPSREDFLFRTSNKQLAFVEHIYRALKAGGRAAVVLPDNVLFEDGVGQKLRKDLMDKCNLHTVLRLPTGIFYAQGVKTNVLFFSRGKKDTGNTTETWFYDLRTNMDSFGKRTPFTREHLKPFEDAFGSDPLGGSKRVDQGEEGRFRRFTREEIAKRGDNLDLTWLKDTSDATDAGPSSPDTEALEIEGILEQALSDVRTLRALLASSDNPSEDAK